MAMGRKLNNSARKYAKNQISSYVSSRPKWLPSTEIWGPLDEYLGRRSCARNQVTWYNLEQSDWLGINYHIGILVYREELKKVKEWLDVNKLSLNIDKTNFIIFKSPQHSSLETVNIKIGNQPVKQSRYVKFLGVLLDENLSWKYHLSELSKKLARTCGMFFKIRHFLPVDVMICLYNSLFPSFLQYGIVVWGLTYDVHIKPIYLLQKRVVKAIAFEHFTSPSTPIFSDLKILKLQDLFQLKLLCFVYDCVNKKSPSCFHKFFESVTNVHQYGTRQATKNDIFLTRKNTLQYGIRSVRFFGAKSWNNIPVDIKRSSSAFSFRQKLPVFLFLNNY